MFSTLVLRQTPMRLLSIQALPRLFTLEIQVVITEYLAV